MEFFEEMATVKLFSIARAAPNAATRIASTNQTGVQVGIQKRFKSGGSCTLNLSETGAIFDLSFNNFVLIVKNLNIKHQGWANPEKNLCKHIVRSPTVVDNLHI